MQERTRNGQVLQHDFDTLIADCIKDGVVYGEIKTRSYAPIRLEVGQPMGVRAGVVTKLEASRKEIYFEFELGSNTVTERYTR